MRNVRVISAALLSGACGLGLSGGALGQSIQGSCYIDYFQAGQPCVCETEAGRQVFTDDASAQFCPLSDEQDLARLTPGITPPEVTPPEVIPPEVPPPQSRQKRNNGIGNGVQAAPGNSDVTNGDAADGADSGRAGPAGAQDGTAANGDPAGAGNNGKGKKNS
jgi:hypothetical protein